MISILSHFQLIFYKTSYSILNMNRYLLCFVVLTENSISPSAVYVHMWLFQLCVLRFWETWPQTRQIQFFPEDTNHLSYIWFSFKESPPNLQLVQGLFIIPLLKFSYLYLITIEIWSHFHFMLFYSLFFSLLYVIVKVLVTYWLSCLLFLCHCVIDY